MNNKTIDADIDLMRKYWPEIGPRFGEKRIVALLADKIHRYNSLWKVALYYHHRSMAELWRKKKTELQKKLIMKYRGLVELVEDAELDSSGHTYVLLLPEHKRDACHIKRAEFEDVEISYLNL